MNRIELEKKYPWIKLSNNSIADYIPPSYYDNLLKEYTFSGKTDLEYFSDYLKEEVVELSFKKILELGCGTGRGTDVFFKEVLNFTSLDLLDMSLDMKKFVKEKYNTKKGIEFIQDDSINFLRKLEGKYDFVFSLWSLSHSIHQHMVDDGLEKGTKDSKKALEKFIVENLNIGGKFFLIHFDSMSDEQRILVRQWKKFFPIFTLEDQSPSKKMLDNIFLKFQDKGIIRYKCVHLVGDAIDYSTLDD